MVVRINWKLRWPEGPKEYFLKISQNSFLALILNLILALGWLWAGYGLLLLINYDKLPCDNGELQKDSTATWGEHSLGLDVAFWESPRGPPRILFPFFHKKKSTKFFSPKPNEKPAKEWPIWSNQWIRISIRLPNKQNDWNNSISWIIIKSHYNKTFLFKIKEREKTE